MKTFKLVVLLVLVFTSGIVVGVVGTRAFVRRVVQNAIVHPERIQPLVERRLTRQLRLDASQQVKLHGILTDAHGQLVEVRSQYRPQVVSVLNHAGEQITAILTPEQQARFEELKQKNRLLMRALQQNPSP